MFRVNVILISLSEAKDVYFMSGEVAVSSKCLDEFAQSRDEVESSDQYLELFLHSIRQHVCVKEAFAHTDKLQIAWTSSSV